ncbi:hypothetical protein MA9V2_073 [Chryseobacterium phage MA9V-2]|nr:hypothetical protein MA9V2_073 [Chryseobacterium phage MA9V-2]
MKKAFKIYVETEIKYSQRYDQGYGQVGTTEESVKIFVETYASKNFSTLKDAEDHLEKMFASNWFGKDAKVTILPIYTQTK